MITKNELIDKIYSLNGKNWQDVDIVYTYDDDDYILRIRNTQNRWNIVIKNKKEHSTIVEISYNLAQCEIIKIKKEQATYIADFVFTAWNTRA